MIKKICIENVKGFGTQKCFDLDIIPNKPSILVAPNGFGKSSLTAAFDSLNANRMNLHKDYYYKGNENNDPYLSVQYKTEGGTLVLLTADKNSNSISNIFDIFIIKNKVEAKAKRQNIGGHTIVSASMEIKPIVLTKIPPRIAFGYSVSTYKVDFGVNGKVLLNITELLNSKNFILLLADNMQAVERAASGLTVQRKIQQFIDEVNQQNQSHTGDELKTWIQSNKVEYLNSINYLSTIAELIMTSHSDTTVDSYLSAIQIVTLYRQNKEIFKKACKYKIYEKEKEGYIEIFSSFNATWKEIKPKEKDGNLILEIPKAHYISNGQRDILTFIALFQQAKNSFKKENCILIIDEVFDYLDDANLIAVQYYITQLIKQLKSEGKKFYPLILTHLNPVYFKSYVFKKQKVYFLDSSLVNTNVSLRKLIQKRNDPLIRDFVSKYILHFHVDHVNHRTAFRSLNLKETWGESQIFYSYLTNEATQYLTNQAYCPFAVCIALRVKIEENIYGQLNDPIKQQEFLEQRGTPKKLNYAEDNGVDVPEIYYLLGVIYNEVAHLKDYVDNNSPLVNKLENITIKNMIVKVYE